MRVIDSHTAGEPTRLIVDGLPESLRCPSFGSVAERAGVHGGLVRRLGGLLCGEPRGSAVMVGAALVEPAAAGCALGLLFFNNVGLLGMCGHGTIGALASLAWLGALQPGKLRVETPVGVVGAELHPDGRSVSVENVRSYRLQAGVALWVPELGRAVHGDIAWGGNWFFLVHDHGLALDPTQIPRLEEASRAIRRALDAAGIRADGAPIDHVELTGPPPDPAEADGQTFVLCPGGVYDRSPCGTGTSARLACLAAEGALAPGQTFRQRSIHGGVFAGVYAPAAGGVVPTIRGTAWVTGDLRLIAEDGDPLRDGLAPGGGPVG